MRRTASQGLIALMLLLAAAACGDDKEAVFRPYVYDGSVPWDGGCEDPGVNCPGKAAFECGMTAMQLSHARCQHRSDCVAAAGPDPADCFDMCGHAAVNRNEEEAYLAEAKVEAYKYCNAYRCIAYPYCPRPDNAELDCTDAGFCAWVEGEWRLPDAGRLDAGHDAGVEPPDAAAPAGPDAETPAGPDAATPAGPDAATPAGPDAAAPAGPDAAAPEPPDAAAPGLDAAPEPPDAAPEPPDAEAEPPDADAEPPDAA